VSYRGWGTSVAREHNRLNDEIRPLARELLHRQLVAWGFYATQASAQLVVSILALAAVPAPPGVYPPFDYEGASERLEGMGVTLVTMLDADGKSMGFHRRMKSSVHADVTFNILDHQEGFCPLRMGEVLATQGKIMGRLP
jgi:hypothetical protein